MGSQMTAYLGIYIPLVTVYKYKNITKYHTTTGKPYEQKVSDGCTIKFAGTDIEFTDTMSDDYEGYHLCSDSFGYFGVTINSLDRDDYDPVILRHMDQIIADHMEEFVEALEEIFSEKDASILAAKAELMHVPHFN